LFVRVLEDLGGLSLVFLAQALIVAFGILATTHAAYRLLRIEEVSWRTFVSSGLAILLVAGYSSTLLQQAIFIEEETVEVSGEVVLPMQETTTEVLLDKMVATTFPTSLKRRWSSSSNT
jgi:hypothetical protein